ncbi:MAG: helix-turn-helix transcriptional regulator [Thiobacillaceae bacterium]
MTRTVLRLPAVKARTGLSRSNLYGRIASGSFPKQFSLGPRAVGWLESEIDSWVEECIAASRQQDEGI